MSLNAEFPAESHVRVDDTWLNNYGTTDAYVDARDLDSTNTGRRQRPRGVSIDRNSSDATATTAVVKGVLWGENHNQADVYTLALGVVHPLSFKYVYAKQTTGRGIKIYG